MRLTRPRRRTSLYRFIALSITGSLSTILAIETVAFALQVAHRAVADIHPVALLVVVAALVGVYNALAVMYIAPVGAFWED